MDGGGSAGQCLNPAFVHSIAVPEVDIVDKVGKVCVVARGDGVVEVSDIESELDAINSKNSSNPGKLLNREQNIMLCRQTLKIRMAVKSCVWITLWEGTLLPHLACKQF